MKIKRYTALAATVLLPLAALAQQALVDYVNPMIGTAGMGHCFPGACAPFGFVQLSPETDTIRTMSTAPIKNRYMPTAQAISTMTLR